MPLICYDRAALVRLKKSERMTVITQANAIITEYLAQGFQLTLRQLYYQFVSRDLIPNRQTEYKRLGDIIVDGRMAGLVDWNAIVDRTRNLESLPHWTSPANIVTAVSEQFRVDKWADQPYRVEVWIEKDALIGVIENICNELAVPYFSCRGYTSISEVWSAGQRLKKYKRNGQTPIILHFGDHDPSGIDMTRDITDRLSLFMGGHMEIRRLALNMEQVEQYNPPPNPAKLTDSRAAGYLQLYGDESWELDALEPAVLAGLIRGEITDLQEADAWEASVQEEEKGRAELAKIADRYEDVTEFLEGDE
jgi:hypothetical protein